MARYNKPKILLVDTPPDAARQLSSRGFNVQTGTFGHAYSVSTGQTRHPVSFWQSLPDVEEQEIVVIDLTDPKLGHVDDGAISLPEGEPNWFCRTNRGFVDPRPRAMTTYKARLDRILQHGGVFVVFAMPRIAEHYLEVTDAKRDGSARSADNWEFLSVLSPHITPVSAFQGRELRPVPSPFESLSAFVREVAPASQAWASIQRGAWKNVDAAFFPLIANKFDDPVGGLILSDQSTSGQVVILPHPNDKVSAIVSLVADVLPEFAARLFVEFEGGKWVHKREYEHPSIVDRKDRQEAALASAQRTVDELNKEIECERQEWQFIHGILTQSGDALVADVKRTLGLLGFKDVREVDADADATEANRQEDLQIHDRRPTLIVEIKGLAQFPTEHDVLQVIKYVQRRMKEWQRFDVQGLVIVNHQRFLPALDRDNGRAFTGEQEKDAELNEFGLLTTWELFRFVRGIQKWSWPNEAILSALYRKGRIGCVPNHYNPVGVLHHFYDRPHVLSIVVNSGCHIAKGDRLGMLVGNEYFEEVVESMEIEHAGVERAPENSKVGIKTSLRRSDLPVGSDIYRVG